MSDKYIQERKKSFAAWMERCPYSLNTVSQYRSYLNKMPQYVENHTNQKIKSAFEISSLREAQDLFYYFRQNLEAILLPLKKDKVRDYNSAFRAYIRFLQESELTFDGFMFSDVGETEKQRLINARIGQSDFRKRLIDIYDGKCAVTGYPHPELLIASHIKPWCECDDAERLDKHNGLLLTPNLDKVFDKGLITFDDDGRIQISQHLRAPEALGISTETVIKLLPEQKEYMQFHRNYKFQA